MTHIYVGRSFGEKRRAYQGDPERCRAAVGSSDGFHWHQCHRKPVVERIVEGKKYGFCKQHDPDAVMKRIKVRDAKWQAEWDAQDKAEERRQQRHKALKACKVALEKIEKGHNDPRSLARETLALFPIGDTR